MRLEENLLAADVSHVLATAQEQKDSEENEVLRQKVKHLESQLQEAQQAREELERDRDYNSAKVVELSQIIEARSKEEVEEMLCTKAMQLAKVRTKLNQTLDRYQEARKKIAALEKEHDDSKEGLVELSRVFFAAMASLPGANQEFVPKQNQVLKPVEALDLTMKAIKDQVEAMEEERTQLIKEIISLSLSLKHQRRTAEYSRSAESQDHSAGTRIQSTGELRALGP